MERLNPLASVSLSASLAFSCSLDGSFEKNREKKLSRGKKLPRIWQSFKSFLIFLYDASKKIIAKCLNMLKFTEGLKLCDLEMPAQARKKSKIAPCLFGAL